MNLRITNHALERMVKYSLNEEQIRACVSSPDLVVGGKSGRRIAQRRLNGYVLRVIYEEMDNEYIVVTAYKAKRERYEI